MYVIYLAAQREEEKFCEASEENKLSFGFAFSDEM